MSLIPSAALPDARTCEQARLSRDARFDGLFFTAVRTTGIYCRPVCPAPTARAANVDYYPSAAAAEAAGFRPCLRCRPELSPGEHWRRGDETVARALALIDQGALVEARLESLAQRVGLGERQLRRLFVQRLGAAPAGVHGTRRLLFAKQLLTETALSVTDVAMAAGFGSLRRFNTSFLEAYGMPPRRLRSETPRVETDALTLRLAYRPPYDFEAMLDFLRMRALPGVEDVGDAHYARLLDDTGDPVAPWLRVDRWPDADALRLQLHGVAASKLLETVTRVRRMFDLDADPNALLATLGRDARLGPLLRARPGLRLPSGWDGFEVAVRAVLGQQVSVAAARTLARRLVDSFGTPVASTHASLMKRFPTPAALADADLAGIGLTRTRADTVRGVARAVLEGRVHFDAGQTLDAFVERWTALPGIGDWTAHYLAMRALGHPDAFPAGDLVLQRQASDDGTRLRTARLRERAEPWRPWRAYAVVHLWRAAGDASPRG